MKNTILLLVLIFPAVQLFGQHDKKDKTKQTETTKPFVLGVIDEIQSKELGEKRTLNIYLPEGYDRNDSIHYPVIYLLDGSANEDFIHIVGLVQFYNFEWINQLPKSIVVGIANVDRRRDFTFPSTHKAKIALPTAGHSDKFISFLEKELQPYIGAHYKTNQDKTIIGQSLGGLLATEVLLKKPTLFNKYIIISPSLWWDNGSLLEQNSAVLAADFAQQTDIYIAVGKEGLTPTEIPRVMEVDANLLADKLKGAKSKAVKVFFDYLPLENHATIMHLAVSNAFKWLYPVTVKE
ncbi:alpha/beta hydrolase [Fluviicola chungangensis]|uniref:Alpha/beta hydrolase n=1 Tax=Fluviicola chungangensis TaxID=2597671 RepID=A0A556N600_9FLAO|nr:alpha/beta hydrolase-fold protein [Fluviicola chungangensis]TSJ47622.1 alpha/beta hydrolase [Fluviicola chungangensis]